LDLRAEVAIGNTDVVLGGAIRGHEVKETVVDVDELEFVAVDVRNVHVVGGRRDIFHFFASEDVDGDKVDLGVAVLAGLGGGHFDDLAGAALDDDVTALAEGRALHGEGVRGAGVGLLEGVVVLLVVRHGVWSPKEGGCM